MRKILTQHCTQEQLALFDISRPVNEKYASDLGFDYITDSVRRCPERLIWWEKIAWLRELLKTVDENSLVVWADADSLILKNESFEKALHTGGIFGMVQNRAGVDGSRLINWFNAGVIVMINNSLVRNFLDRVWVRPDETDEAAIVYELRHNGWIVGDGIKVSSLDMKWNKWRNNEHLCQDPVVQSWHGTKMEKKLGMMKGFMAGQQ